ncbi:MAG: ribosome small subunit-dependent GTPase A [Clostridia bacterium]
MNENIGLVTRIVLDKYILKDESTGEVVEATLRGNVKKRNNILVGDKVTYNKSYDKNMINTLIERKNYLIRPPVANIEQLIIVLSIKDPKPDYILLDKQLILCKQKNIKPVICINKMDLAFNDEEVKKDIEYIKKVYANLGISIIYLSAKQKENIDILKEVLKGSISTFSGNSGVGKSSIIKLLINKEDELEVGSVGNKTKRGKHTTKYVKLYEVGNDSYILDTPGFSSYELFELNHKDLRFYYDDFLKYKCEYDDCMHVKEESSVCKIKEKVKDGRIDLLRYERYVYIFNELKEKYEKRYK